MFDLSNEYLYGSSTHYFTNVLQIKRWAVFKPDWETYFITISM